MSDDSIDDDEKKEEIVDKTIDVQTEDLIRDALKSFVKEKLKDRKTDDELEAMVSTCSEFMKCFIIIGYDFEGNAIKPVFYAKNDLDADALGQYIQKFLVSSLQY
jgi:hypothetical protein